jgi:hypothetical protein
VRKNPTVVAAIYTTIASVLVGAAALTGQLITSNPPNCSAIAGSYARQIEHKPERVTIFTDPGPDGKSILASDEDAISCGIDEMTLRRMADP